MSENTPDPDQPHVFQQVLVPPVSHPSDALAGGGFAGAPPTGMTVSSQCELCHRPKDDRLHIEAEQNDSKRWPL